MRARGLATIIVAVGVISCWYGCGLNERGTADGLPDAPSSSADASTADSISVDGAATASVDGSKGSGEAAAPMTDGAADGSLAQCTICSASCPQACQACTSSGDSYCPSNPGDPCHSSCSNCSGANVECSVCDATGANPKHVCTTQSVCDAIGNNCKCTDASQCPDGNDVCASGYCVNCSQTYNGQKCRCGSNTCQMHSSGYNCCCGC
jgi:hypothetical protein